MGINKRDFKGWGRFPSRTATQINKRPHENTCLSGVNGEARTKALIVYTAGSNESTSRETGKSSYLGPELWSGTGSLILLEAHVKTVLTLAMQFTKCLYTEKLIQI